MELTGATGGMLMLWDVAEGCLVMRKVIRAPELATARVLAGEGATGTAFATGQPQTENSYQQFEGAIPIVRD